MILKKIKEISMSKFVVFPNSFIQPEMLDMKPFAVSLNKLRPETWMNKIQMIKCIKNTATRNNSGVVLFDNRKEAYEFCNRYSGYVTDLQNGTVVHANHWATAFDPTMDAAVVKFNTNTYGHTLNTLLWEDCTFIYHDSPVPSLRATTYLSLPEIRVMLKIKK